MDDLQLDLALSNQNLGQNPDFSTEKKRKFHDLFSDDTSCSNKRTLPLLIWDDNNPNNVAAKFEDDFDDQIHTTQHSAITDRESRIRCVDVEEDVMMVGWPPVKSSMKKMAEQRRRESTASNYIAAEQGGGGGGGGGGGDHNSSMYVKVEMEGIRIARKIDLSVHRSYESLTATVIAMFGKRLENLKMYKLTYQDNEGDWLLAGDVPWGSFVGSVRRLKLLRKEW